MKPPSKSMILLLRTFVEMRKTTDEYTDKNGFQIR